MEQTAVELLAKELYKKMEMKGDGEVFNKILKKAKKIEKKQIIDAYRDGYNDHFFTYGNNDENDDQEGSIDGPIYKSPAHYYKKSYKKTNIELKPNLNTT